MERSNPVYSHPTQYALVLNASRVTPGVFWQSLASSGWELLCISRCHQVLTKTPRRFQADLCPVLMQAMGMRKSPMGRVRR
jgi:hypothetical protein